jgi:hypothetical protein
MSVVRSRRSLTRWKIKMVFCGSLRMFDKQISTAIRERLPVGFVRHAS